jgi:hypothetical protein
MKSIWTKLLILCLLPISLEVVTQMRVIQPAIAQFQLTPEEEEALASRAIRQLVVQSQTRSGRPEPPDCLTQIPQKQTQRRKE